MVTCYVVFFTQVLLELDISSLIYKAYWKLFTDSSCLLKSTDLIKSCLLITPHVLFRGTAVHFLFCSSSSYFAFIHYLWHCDFILVTGELEDAVPDCCTPVSILNRSQLLLPAPKITLSGADDVAYGKLICSRVKS